MSPDLLRQATGCTAERAALYAPLIDEACQIYQIDTPQRLAAFLAQIGHESGSFRYTAEIWGPTMAQRRYEGRQDLGNVQPGDGERFKGRGLIQVTGRHNYRRAGSQMRAAGIADAPDFEAQPELLEQPRWAALSAANFWANAALNPAADRGDFEWITRRINGGTNGAEDRNRRWALAKSVLSAAPTPPAPASVPEPVKEKPVSVPAIVAALLPSLIEKVPRLIDLFKGSIPTAERNSEAAKAVFAVAKEALGAVNEQQVIERLQQDGAAVATVRQAVEDHWYQLSEAGGGGIAGARQADVQFASGGDPVWRSPSFLIAVALLPLLYLVVGAVVGLFGAPFSEDVRAAIANSIIGLILGGLIGYYYGQTTSRNRQTP